MVEKIKENLGVIVAFVLGGVIAKNWEKIIALWPFRKEKKEK